MKLKIFSFLLLMSAVSGYAQKEGLGVHFGGFDFYGPQGGGYFFVDRPKINYQPDNAGADTVHNKVLLWQPLVRITYWHKINKMFDISAGLSVANLQYPKSSNDSAFKSSLLNGDGQANGKIYMELDARANYNILEKKKHFAAPYVFAGLAMSMRPIYFGADLPLGAGVNFRLDKKSKNLYLNLEAAYEVPLTAQDYSHLQYTGGLVYWFKAGYKAPVEKQADAPTLASAIAEVMNTGDMDHDGVPDSVDKCPTIPGLPEFNGCPDTDGDGVPDEEDECPLVAGLKQFNGCPDTDHDGIPDNKDKCPYEAGPADNGGCPVADRDHDGVPDAEDRCPDVYGTLANHGCPEIKKEIHEAASKAARDIFFDEGKATLKKNSYASLNKMVKILKDDQSLYLDIEGYTDNVGNSAVNMTLSDRRANACRDYLVSKGINADRLTAKGHGEEQPIADNRTEAGRAKNRRTEMKLRNYK